eukprot:CAMPEP_0204392592 /NCGR_PEP_ID=MMETSP0469-20131031/61840_1 /ASSEMBLY_ACC=CAM_ASM_000384 /TAXON_ID=2969 /ORGANISM="Oxyrrhis marina" /LENGTH=61 /DNA_ID=CAMNT_0051386573 /DNA_START=52 /DNA_END=237 /DNA_ORIENTATION=-
MRLFAAGIASALMASELTCPGTEGMSLLQLRAVGKTQVAETDADKNAGASVDAGCASTKQG